MGFGYSVKLDRDDTLDLSTCKGLGSTSEPSLKADSRLERLRYDFALWTTAAPFPTPIQTYSSDLAHVEQQLVSVEQHNQPTLPFFPSFYE